MNVEPKASQLPPGTPRSSTRFTEKFVIAALCIICLLMLIPFASRPFHIDDPMFIWTAQHIVDHPFNFYGFSINWGRYLYAVNAIFPIPPLTSYYLAVVSLLTGWREVYLHLAFLPFSLLSVAGTYFIARRFCRRPGLCTLLVMFCPAFWVSSTTLMCEPALLCYWIWAIVFWLWGCDGSGWFLLFAALAAVAANLTKLTALGLIPLFCLYALLTPGSRRTRFQQTGALFLILIGIFCYNIYFSHLYGTSAFSRAVQYSNNSHEFIVIPFGHRVVDTLVFTGGGAATAGLFALIGIWRPRVSLMVLIFTAALALILAASVLPPPGWIESHADSSGLPIPEINAGSFAYYFQFAAMLTFAIVFIFHAVSPLARRIRIGGWRDDLFLISWIGGIYIFAGFLNWSINIRSILVLVPAVCIVVVRAMDGANQPLLFRGQMAILLGGGLALALAIGDYKLAVVGKAAAQTLPPQIGSIAQSAHTASPPRLWFVGHWGFQYYMQAAGFQELNDNATIVRNGDYLLVPLGGFGGDLYATGFKFVRRFEIGTDSYASTTQYSMGAGFYHSDGSSLPYVFGPIPAESFILMQVTPNTHVDP